MLGYNRLNPTSAPMFIVKSSALFSRTHLTPYEFGREITRLGFVFAVEQFEQYLQTEEASSGELPFLEEVRNNPGLIQLLFANLITGAFLCYAKVMLNVPFETIDEVEAGVLSELRATLDHLDEDVLKEHRHITSNFSIALEREIKDIETASTSILFLKYIADFYPGLVSKQSAPIVLIHRLNGLGSRFMAICQNQFSIIFQEGS